MPPIKELLFDCDNTLVLSEDIAFESCAQLANEILAAHGVVAAGARPYDGRSLQHEFVGMGFRGQLAALQAKHGFAMPAAEVQRYVDQELGRTIENLERSCEPCEGVGAVLEQLAERGRPGLAVVSSSAMGRVEASLRKTGQDRYFPHGRVFSAASSLDPPSSKPDPAVYLFACEKLGVKPGECVAIEDSKSGATAAKRAGIPTIGYVGPYLAEGGKEKQDEMVKILKEDCSVAAIMYHWSEFWDILKQLEA
ncbi:hypothetical protein SLS62_000436 [Diatrype stigma]|uniref:HAD superfamily hydrolase n=1 Tax=Diatrype stigma TaxID=117547 RepID=A0AAN9UZU2_9PEZI